MRLGLGVVAASFAFSGCWGARFVKMPSYTEETRAEVMDLSADSKETRERVESLEAILAEQTELLRAMRAEAASSIELLSARIAAMEENIGSSGDRRARVYTPPPAQASASADSAAEPASVVDADREHYDAAYLELLKGNYDLAIASFQEYLARFPDTDLADNAQYWIGECHFARGETADAIDSFLAVETRWPNSDKIPGALLKVAYCHQNENNTAGARRVFEELIARYPNSDEARLSREKLAALPGGG